MCLICARYCAGAISVMGDSSVASGAIPLMGWSRCDPGTRDGLDGGSLAGTCERAGYCVTAQA